MAQNKRITFINEFMFDGYFGIEKESLMERK